MFHLIAFGILAMIVVAWVIFRGYGFYKMNQQLKFKDGWDNLL